MKYKTFFLISYSLISINCFVFAMEPPNETAHLLSINSNEFQRSDETAITIPYTPHTPKERALEEKLFSITSQNKTLEEILESIPKINEIDPNILTMILYNLTLKSSSISFENTEHKKILVAALLAQKMPSALEYLKNISEEEKRTFLNIVPNNIKDIKKAFNDDQTTAIAIALIGANFYSNKDLQTAYIHSDKKISIDWENFSSKKKFYLKTRKHLRCANDYCFWPLFPLVGISLFVTGLYFGNQSPCDISGCSEGTECWQFCLSGATGDEKDFGQNCKVECTIDPSLLLPFTIGSGIVCLFSALHTMFNPPKYIIRRFRLRI